MKETVSKYFFCCFVSTIKIDRHTCKPHTLEKATQKFQPYKKQNIFKSVAFLLGSFSSSVRT